MSLSGIATGSPRCCTTRTKSTSTSASWAIRLDIAAIRNGDSYACVSSTSSAVFASEESATPVTATVSDDGVGWPDDRHRDAEPGHAGLRLATAAVESAGGQLRLLPAESASGSGAAALVTLPRS